MDKKRPSEPVRWLIGTIIALAALGATVFFGFFNHSTSPPSTNPNAGTTGTTATNPTNSTGTSVTSPSAPVSTPTTTSHIRHTGRLTLTYGYAADLDTQDRNWDVTNRDSAIANGNFDVDLFDQGLQAPITSSSQLASVTGPAVYTTCADATAYSTTPVAATAGAKICVQTTENRYAFIRVLSANEAGGDPSTMTATMSVTVWDPPFK